MYIWCHSYDCRTLIRNDDEFMGIPPGQRSHVTVMGVPFCTECHEQNGPYHRVRGVPVKDEDVEQVVGDGTPATSERYEAFRQASEGEQ